MFGFFEMRIPAGLQTFLDGKGRRLKGGALLGSYLMGLLSALVISPCVSAPLAGALLQISLTGNAMQGALALFVLGMGMGAPLMLLGATEGRLLPKAGPWMDHVKFFFGILLLFIASGFLDRITQGPWAGLMYAFCLSLTGFWLWQLQLRKGLLQHIPKALGVVVLGGSLVTIAHALT